MELIEKTLRDFLHDLLKGGNSPNEIQLSNDLLGYIKSRSTDIA